MIGGGKILKTALLFFTFSSGFSQNDSTRFYTLLQTGNDNMFDSAVVFKSYYEAEKIANKSGDLRLIATINMALGKAYYNNNRPDTTIGFWTKSSKLFKQIHDTVNWARSERLIGVYYDKKGDLIKALEHFTNAQNLFKKIAFVKGLGECYISMAIVYQRIQKYDLALKHHHLALDIALQEGNTGVISPILNNIGSLYSELEQFDSAYKYFKLSLKENESFNNTVALQSLYHNLGSVEFGRKNFNEAILYYQKAIDGKGGLSSSESISSIMMIGLTYLEIKQLDSAEFYLDLALNMAKQTKELSYLKEVYDFMSRLEEEKGNYKQALNYYKLLALYSDSLRMIFFDEQLQSMVANQELEQRTNELNSLQIEKERNEALLTENEKRLQILILLSALLLVAFLLLIVIFRRIVQERKILTALNKELDWKSSDLTMYTQELEKTLSDKNDLVSVIAHDLRSPFAKIQSIVQLIEFSDDVEEKKIYLGMVASISREGMSLIQDLIDLSRFDDRQLIEDHTGRIKSFTMSDVIDRLENSFKISLSAKQIKFQKELSNELIDNREDLVERICDNLLSNAIKYSKQGGNIHVTAKPENDYMVLSIKDNGPGFKEEDLSGLFKRFSRLSARPSGIESSTGLGLYIAKQLAISIEGNIELTSKLGESACFEVRFPMNLKNKLNS